MTKGDLEFVIESFRDCYEHMKSFNSFGSYGMRLMAKDAIAILADELKKCEENRVAKACPYTDFESKVLREGDYIRHPDGSTARVVFLPKGRGGDYWFCDYGDGILSRLCLQVGDKGRALRFTRACSSVG